jgi:hypothetical protein
MEKAHIQQAVKHRLKKVFAIWVSKQLGMSQKGC